MKKTKINMSKNTIKLNESQIRKIVAESVKRFLKEYTELKRPNEYVVKQFGKAVENRAVQDNIQPTDEAILNLAQQVYQENFSQYENSLINYWKGSGINWVKRALGPKVKSEPAFGAPGQKTDWGAVEKAYSRTTPEMIKQSKHTYNPYEPERKTSYLPSR